MNFSSEWESGAMKYRKGIMPKWTKMWCEGDELEIEKKEDKMTP